MPIYVFIWIFIPPIVLGLFITWVDARHEKKYKKAYNDERLYRQYDELVKERWERKLYQ